VRTPTACAGGPRREGQGHHCTVCNAITDIEPCAYCSDEARDRTVVCVVEEAQNVGVIEKTREFKGLYHVLMGAISPLQGIGPDELKIKGLLARVQAGVVQEVILATNPNVEGEATASTSRACSSRWACA